jgi:AcrR family transcriptional regulator
MNRCPGRPRNKGIDRALAIQTLRLLAKQGYVALSLGDVAASAGIGKTTLYRRYPNKKSLALAALSTIVAQAPRPVDTGSLERDLLTLARDTWRMFSKLNILPLLSALIVQGEHDPRPLNLVRRHVIIPRRRLIRSLLEREQRRGNISRKINLDIAVDDVIGTFFWRQIASLPMSDQWLRAAIKQHAASWK